MTENVYGVDQVGAVRVVEARAILTESGLPGDTPAPFEPADALRPLDVDPGCLVLGSWGAGGVLIALDTGDGRVVGHTPWSPGLYPVSTSLRWFVDCLDALAAAAPLSADNPRHGSLRAAGHHVLAQLQRIDPDELAHPDSFWLSIVDDIENGDYVPG